MNVQQESQQVLTCEITSKDTKNNTEWINFIVKTIRVTKGLTRRYSRDLRQQQVEWQRSLVEWE